MTQAYGETVAWEPAAPRIRPAAPARLAGRPDGLGLRRRALVPGVALDEPGAGLLVALSLALLNAIVPPVLAALRLPFMVAIGFIRILLVDAALLLLVDAVLPGLAARGRLRRRAADVAA